ncbi:MAG: response regulator [Rickettsiales bacterium]
MSENQYKLKILIIDDNEDDFETMQRATKKIEFPCSLYWCESGQKGYNFLKQIAEKESSSELPNIIFLDINMPGLDGKQTLDLIKKDRFLSSIPILMFTTSSNEKDIKDCYGLGASSYIPKPHSYEDLIKIFKVIDQYWLDVSALPKMN